MLSCLKEREKECSEYFSPIIQGMSRLQIPSLAVQSLGHELGCPLYWVTNPKILGMVIQEQEVTVTKARLNWRANLPTT